MLHAEKRIRMGIPTSWGKPEKVPVLPLQKGELKKTHQSPFNKGELAGSFEMVPRMNGHPQVLDTPNMHGGMYEKDHNEVFLCVVSSFSVLELPVRSRIFWNDC